jgi:hypothetical protein
MTKITGSSSNSTRGYGNRSEDTTPAADTARTSANPVRTGTQGTQSTGTQGTQETQGTQATQAAARVQAEYFRDSFTPAVASAGATPTATPAVANAAELPERVNAAAGSMSSSSLGDGPEPIDQVGGVNGNGGPMGEYRYDGGLIDGQGNVYPPGTSREGLAPTTPHDGPPAGETLYYVNGIQTTAEQQATSMQNIADTTGANVFGIHNTTWGFTRDLAQSGIDKLPGGDHLNPATTALADTIMQDLEAGNPVHVVAHSQGALITSGALGQVQDRLTEAHGAERAAEMMSTIQVETFGGAAASYPYGPQYVHYVNEDDLVPMQTGLGSIEDPAERQEAAGGDRAAIHFIRDDPRQEPEPDVHAGALGNNLTSHDFNDGYLAHRLPFEEAHADNRDLGGASPVRQEDGTAVYHEEAPPSEAEANERRATQAAADSARALAEVEAAVSSGDLAAARAAAAPLEEYARVAEEAHATAQALHDANIDAATMELDAAGVAESVVAPGLSGSHASLEEIAQARARTEAAAEALADLQAGVTDTATAAEQTQEHLARATELLRQLELGSVRRGAAIAG